MLRYAGLSWRIGDSGQSEFSSHIVQTLLSTEGTSLHSIDTDFQIIIEGHHPGIRIQHFPNAMGILIGSLYRQPGDSLTIEPYAPIHIDEEQATHIVNSQGGWLMDHAWGSYVAFLNSPKDGSRYVIASPGGEMPCHLTRQAGVSLVFSDIQPLLKIKALRFSINDKYLQHRLALGGLTDQPPLAEVRPVQRGGCIKLNADTDAPHHYHWHPLKIIENTERIDDPSRAAALLRIGVHSCTRTLAAPHTSMLLRLSGGLDSSIIAGCLRGHGKQSHLATYTFYSPRARSQEPRWANLVATHHDLRHQNIPVDVEHILSGGMTDLPPLIEPASTLSYIMRSRFEQPLVDEHRASAIFTGDGGDSGFCGESYAYALTDYLEHHGLDSRIFSLAAQIAALTHQSSWTVLRRSIHRWRHGADMQQHRQLMAPTLKLINPELLQLSASQQTYPHPWFEHMDRVPWPLIRRLGMLVAPPQAYDVATPERAPEIIAPLYAQPVMELLLRIPSYVHFLSGQERGLARHAFLEDLPAEIVKRRWKDRPAGFMEEIMKHNRAFFRALFLDGELVRRGLLNSAAVTDALDGRTSHYTYQPVELLRYLDYEFWLRAWRVAR